jgi:hypothetical protein
MAPARARSQAEDEYGLPSRLPRGQDLLIDVRLAFSETRVYLAN